LSTETIIIPSSIKLELNVEDSEVILELNKRLGDERIRFALSALKLGIQASKLASGSVDAGQIKDAGEEILTQVKDLVVKKNHEFQDQIQLSLIKFIDPETGLLLKQLQAFSNQGGPLDSVLQRHLEGDESSLKKILDQHFGSASPLMRSLSPQDAEGLRSQVEEALKRQLREQSEHIMRQFSLDDPKSALNSFLEQIDKKQLALGQGLNDQVKLLLGEMTLDNSSGSLRRVQEELAKVLDQIGKKQDEFILSTTKTLAEMTGRKDEAARGTRHGLTFEAHLIEVLTSKAIPMGDVVSAVGTKPGTIKNCKTGDCVIEMGPESPAPSAKIVFEAKEDSSYKQADAIREIQEARVNRNAGVGVFVFSAKTAPAGMPRLSRMQENILVTWDDEAGDDLIIEAALSLAHALAVQVSQIAPDKAEALEAINRSIRAIEKLLDKTENFKKMGESMKNDGEKLVDQTRILSDEILRQVKALDSSLKELKA
jgi:hypothetical protein